VLTGFYAGADDEGPVIAVESTPAEANPELVLFTVRDLDREQVNRQIREGGLSPLHNIRAVTKLEAIPVLGTGKTDYRALKDVLKAGVKQK
jgi:long-chain-fatty-acid--[acyl-carrier-protein] ligase